MSYRLGAFTRAHIETNLYPFAYVFYHLGRGLFHFMGIEPVHPGTSHSEDDLRKMVSASEKGGSIDPVESRLIDNVFDFADRVAREVMVPRQDMVCLFVDDTVEENLAVIKESGHTRYPLCREDRDHILGIIHIRELMNADYQKPDFNWTSIMREIDVVPESMSIAKILQLMQHKHVQMAAVADEYGGTAGLVTMEDLLEEIVGDIQDEHDTDMPEINKMPDGSYVFDGWCFWMRCPKSWASSLMNRKRIPSGAMCLASLAGSPWWVTVWKPTATSLRCWILPGSGCSGSGSFP